MSERLPAATGPRDRAEVAPENPHSALRTPRLTLIHRPRSYVERLDLAGVFAAVQPLEVELGAGDGSFLAEYARDHPEHNFLGVERLLGRLRKLDRKGLRSGLANLRLLRLEASYVVEYLLPPGSVRALHIYFPDPWPKRRHHKNRLINPRFVAAAGRTLEPKGRIYLRTDDSDYFRQITEVFASTPAFQPVETPIALSGILTDFERDFRGRGIPTLRCAFERVASEPR